MLAAPRRRCRAQMRASRGFTLIEMSIVLVIIGLLIGGILKGQEVIAAARSKAVIQEINAARAATNTYYDRYRALPGDDLLAAQNLDPRLVDGNGDGVVGPNPGPSTAQGMTTFSTGNQNENYQYWKALNAAGLLNGSSVGPVGQIQSQNFGAGSSLPTAPITGSGLTVVYGTHDGDTSTITTKKTGHWYRLHKNPQNATPVFSPRELANIDNQIDDGDPNDGGVRGDGGALCAPQALGATYAVSDNVACVGFFFGHP